jgi:heme A synthase
MAVILGWWALTFPRRRHAASPIKVPMPVVGLVAALGFAALALAINAIIAPAERIAGIYAASVTVILICGGMMFLYSLISLYEPPRGPKRPKPRS